ncbi:MAG TPA: PepSY domain-containing protein [Kofleriaceae bacterium]|nr:PepSY domain-containing protein [Kofleriaceae bacterium]
MLWAKFWVTTHRWLAIVLVSLLVVWSVSGLLFHIKPGWDRAYDQLSVERRDSVLPLQTFAPPQNLGSSITRIELFDTAIGPLYRVRTSSGTELYDAATGKPRTLDATAVRTLIADAIERSQFRAAYGEITNVAIAGDTARVMTSGGPVVELGVHDARASQRGRDTDRIDWLYRIHYLQWTGNRTIDKWLALAGLALIWAVMIPGVVLFVRRFRR